MPSDKAKGYFSSHDPLEAMSGLRALFGSEQKHPDVLMRLLQLGNEIKAEEGMGRDDQVLQLISALLQSGVGHDMRAMKGR